MENLHDFTPNATITVFGARHLEGRRAAFQSQPKIAKVAEKFYETIAAEDREVCDVKARALKMRPDGHLVSIGAGGLSKPALPTPHAFGQLGQRIEWPAHGKGYLLACPDELRAANVNHWLQAAGDVPIRLRARTRGTGREVFAAVSDKFVAHDTSEVLRMLLANVPAGARGQIAYNGQITEVTLTFMDLHSDTGTRKVGDAFLGGLRARWGEDGTARYRIGSFLGRLKCNNGLVCEEAAATMEAMHTARDLADRIKAMCEASVGNITRAVNAYSAAAKEKILEGFDNLPSPEPVFAALVSKELIDVPAGVDDEEFVKRLVRAWEKERGWSRADLINAITRAAHEEVWSNPWSTSHLEEQAGELLYQHVAFNQAGELRVADLDLN